MRKAVIFDLDDTLYPESSYNISGFQAVGWHVSKYYGMKDFGTQCITLFNQGIRGDIFDRVLNANKMEIPVLDLINVYRSHSPAIALYNDARVVLTSLSRSVPLGLITDGYRMVQRRKVAALGIEPFFTAIVFSDDEGPDSWKPSPRPYIRLINEMSKHADDFIYCGDNPKKDFITARKLGWQTVMVDRGLYDLTVIEPEYHADILVTSLEQVPWHVLGVGFQPPSHSPN
ncbi:HAD family hydrolase [Geothrix sp. PMB-07]|uniref:HAD family hydrolase n=1 Tax=Geothrix sp. PMB-07 TaxID=3068640 RepID=UPI002741F413|nr:HAD family hydrolase [Geothrix sp. PMB-07]WLT32816.1 HAD family hydrolase [Geothrix sp. PMB-07]